MKLSGRAEAPDTRRGRTLAAGVRRVEPLTPHGPLQRSLDAIDLTPRPTSQTVSAENAAVYACSLDHVRTIHYDSPLPKQFQEKQLTERIGGADGHQHASARE